MLIHVHLFQIHVSKLAIAWIALQKMQLRSWKNCRRRGSPHFDLFQCVAATLELSLALKSGGSSGCQCCQGRACHACCSTFMRWSAPFASGAGLFRTNLHTTPFVGQALHLWCVQATRLHSQMQWSWSVPAFQGIVETLSTYLRLTVQNHIQFVTHSRVQNWVLFWPFPAEAGTLSCGHPPRQWDRRNIFQNSHPILHRVHSTLFQCLLLLEAQIPYRFQTFLLMPFLIFIERPGDQSIYLVIYKACFCQPLYSCRKTAWIECRRMCAHLSF